MLAQPDLFVALISLGEVISVFFFFGKIHVVIATLTSSLYSCEKKNNYV